MNTDYIIVGSGIAGLTFALSVAESGRVVIVTKKDDAESATNMAQGGIAAVVDAADSFAAHVEDTVEAGEGLCNREAVEIGVRGGAAAVAKLTDWGAEFTTEQRADGAQTFALGREGGHSARRIIHAADMTGKEIESSLLAAINDHPNIEILEDHIALDLIVRDSPAGERACVGVYVLDEGTCSVISIVASVTVLATGGCGRVYLYTTNPDIATGDGIAMAFRAGVPVRNMEFVQFHPTCLYHPDVRSFLISEAVRGEGALLLSMSGERIMDGVDSRRELAPRDVVARAIDRTMKMTGDKHVYLDISHLDADRVRLRFPNIYAKLAELGIDMTTDPIPVVPAAHYLCGGIEVDMDCRTALRGLFACGEVAHTGMHGANRLASNSLLEAVVFSARAAEVVKRELGDREDVSDSAGYCVWEGNAPGPVSEGVLIDYNWDIVRRLMWDYVGIVRSERRLELAVERMATIRREVTEYFDRYSLNSDLVELRNIALVGELIVRCALNRRESRGLHYMEDYPERDDARFKRDTILMGGSIL
jgi:L-aspartate oxidase